MHQTTRSFVLGAADNDQIVSNSSRNNLRASSLTNLSMSDNLAFKRITQVPIPTSLHILSTADAMGGKFCESGGCNSWLWWGE